MDFFESLPGNDVPSLVANGKKKSEFSAHACINTGFTIQTVLFYNIFSIFKHKGSTSITSHESK